MGMLESEKVNGGILMMTHRRERASHPVGTTVRLSDLFKLLPVRKQTALKTAAKCLGRIKRTMQAYALARPSVRFSLRILKAKNEKGNWLYAPKTDATVEDAALKVVGKDCAGQCAWHSVEHEGYKVEALLPKQDADFSKINNVGQFISVDSRPVSAIRGFLKKIGVLFKDNLRGRASGITGDLKDPFLMMNLVCPPQSYDANVEPAKDDVMFENSDIVLDAVQKLLNLAYPEVLPHRQSSSPILLEDASDEPERSAKRQRITNHSMWDNDNESMLDQPQHVIEEEEEEGTLRDVSVHNPWTLAKVTSSIRPLQAQHTQGVPGTSSPISRDHRVMSPKKSVVKEHEIPAYPLWSLPTPEQSSSPVPRVAGRDLAVDVKRYRDCSSVEHMLPTPQQHKIADMLDHDYERPLARLVRGVGSKTSLSARPNDFVTALEMPLGTSWEPQTTSNTAPFRHSAGGRKNRNPANPALHRPFAPPVMNSSRAVMHEDAPAVRDGDIRAAFGSSVNSAITSLPTRQRTRQQRPRVDLYEDDDELEDLEARVTNELAAPRQTRIRTFQMPRHTSPDSNSEAFNDMLRQETPHFNQTALSDQSPNLPSPQRLVEPQSARAKRARVRTRSSTAHLPLESVPTGYHVHDLSLTLCTSLASVAATAKELQRTLEATLPPLPIGVWDVLSANDDDVEIQDDEVDSLDLGSATWDRKNITSGTRMTNADEALSSTTKHGKSFAPRSTFTDPTPSVGECNSWRESVLEFLRQQRVEE